MQQFSTILTSAFLLLLLLLPLTTATTTIHYYKNPSCNSGTDVGKFDAPLNATADDTTCHAIENTVKALYINGVDAGCVVITYTTSTCDPSSASPNPASKGDCSYREDFGVVAAWKSVCGTEADAAKSSLSALGGGSNGAAQTGTGSGSGSASASASVNASGTGTAGSARASATSNAADFTKRLTLDIGGQMLGLGWSGVLGALVLLDV